MPKDLAVIFQSQRKSLQKKANKRELERTWFSMVFWALGIPFEVGTFLLQWKYSCSFRIQLCLRSLCLWCGRHLLGWNLLVFPLLCSVVMISVLHCLSRRSFDVSHISPVPSELKNDQVYLSFKFPWSCDLQLLPCSLQSKTNKPLGFQISVSFLIPKRCSVEHHLLDVITCATY